MKLITACITLMLLLHPMTTTVVFAKEKVVHVDIINTKGDQIGKATLTQNADLVKIHIEASQLTPGSHGIHIHETGKCDPPDFKTAGAHFNPSEKKHGFNNPQGFHGGDLPNIEVNEDGTVNVEIVTAAVTLEKKKPNSIIKKGGTTLIIHADADDYITDPAGNSGERIACGAIK